MERFALLSVFSRLGALFMLAGAYALDHSVFEQVLGVTVDVVLALVTGAVLRQMNDKRFKRAPV
jgi:hypothetical protein